MLMRTATFAASILTCFSAFRSRAKFGGKQKAPADGRGISIREILFLFEQDYKFTN